MDVADKVIDLYGKSNAISSDAGLDILKCVAKDEELKGYVKSKESVINDYCNTQGDMTLFEAATRHISFAHKTVLALVWNSGYWCMRLFSTLMIYFFRALKIKLLVF